MFLSTLSEPAGCQTGLLDVQSGRKVEYKGRNSIDREWCTQQ